MLPLTSFIAQLFPGWAAKRVMAETRLAAATRMYDAIKHTPYRPRRGDQSSGDAVMQATKGRMREYGRWLDENYDLATGLLDDLVAKIVGTGIGVEPTVQDSAGKLLPYVNDKIKELWRQWWESPEVTGEIPGPDVERIICRTWLRDGEVFIQHVTKDFAPYNTDIPYSLELLEPDFVPFDYFERKNGITHGIQKDTWGRPIGYWVYKKHPGNIVNSGTLTDELKWIPAENMLHLKFVKRLHQTRGISIFHSVFTRLDDLKDIDESMRIKMRVEAAFCAFVKKSVDYSYGETDPITGARQFQMAPGMIFDNLNPGEEIESLGSNNPNPELVPYRSDQIRAIAAGTGTSASSIAKKFDSNYSARRQELVESTVHYRRLFSYLMWKFYLPVWRRFIDAALFSGELQVPRNVKQATLYYPEFRPPTLPWIDPLKEVLAHKEAIAIRIRARQQSIRDFGGDPQAVDAQIAADPYQDVYGPAGASPNTDNSPNGGSENAPAQSDGIDEINEMEEAA